MRYYCKCGVYFGKDVHLREHIGICVPHWPRVSENDEHARVTEEQWHEWKKGQYAILQKA